jgi:HSP20 family protein
LKQKKHSFIVKNNDADQQPGYVKSVNTRVYRSNFAVHPLTISYMKDPGQDDGGCSVYPGDYVPLLKAEEMESQLSMFNQSEQAFLPANITEFTDNYRVELAIPGAKREDFFIQSDGNILSVLVLHQPLGCTTPETFQLQEFNYNCCKRFVLLPKDADSEFLSTEYKDGILRLHVPKVKGPVKKLQTTIVVY